MATISFAHGDFIDGGINFISVFAPDPGLAKLALVGLIKGFGAVAAKAATAAKGAEGFAGAINKELPVLRFSRERTPEIVRNIENALRNGKPNVLTRIENRSLIR